VSGTAAIALSRMTAIAMPRKTYRPGFSTWVAGITKAVSGSSLNRKEEKRNTLLCLIVGASLDLTNCRYIAQPFKTLTIAKKDSTLKICR
jgi:hypothetical protein